MKSRDDSKIKEVATGRPLALLIEDDQATTTVFRLFLEADGYEVATVKIGSDATSAAQTINPDVIILDILLPEMDGWEVLSQLKSVQDTREIPVVIISVLDRQHYGFDLGAIDYLVKPVNKEQLLDAVRRAVHKGRFPARDRKVLVAHSDAEALEKVAAALTPEGYDLILAIGGREAVCLAKSFSPDLIAIDIHLTDLDIRELITALNRDPATRHTHFLVLCRRDEVSARESIMGQRVHYLPVAAEGERAKIAQMIDYILGNGNPNHET